MALSQAEFNRLLNDHAPVLYRMAYRMVSDRHDAEDIVQDTFRSVWMSRRRYQPGLGERAWLVSILRRRVIDRWRKRSPLPPGNCDVSAEVAAPDQDFDTGYSDEMQFALEHLPPDLRETLLLVVVGELTHQEAADELGVPIGTVLSRVSRARQRMREYLTAHARRAERSRANK